MPSTTALWNRRSASAMDPVRNSVQPEYSCSLLLFSPTHLLLPKFLYLARHQAYHQDDAENQHSGADDTCDDHLQRRDAHSVAIMIARFANTEKRPEHRARYLPRAGLPARCLLLFAICHWALTRASHPLLPPERTCMTK